MNGQGPGVHDLLVDIYLALGRPWFGNEEGLVDRIATVQTAVEWAALFGDPVGLERAVERADAARVRRADRNQAFQ